MGSCNEYFPERNHIMMQFIKFIKRRLQAMTTADLKLLPIGERIEREMER